MSREAVAPGFLTPFIVSETAQRQATVEGGTLSETAASTVSISAALTGTGSLSGTLVKFIATQPGWSDWRPKPWTPHRQAIALVAAAELAGAGRLEARLSGVVAAAADLEGESALGAHGRNDYTLADEMFWFLAA